jgi:hypothetical protein
MKARVPHWPLERVKELVAAGQVFVQRTRAMDFFPTADAAYAQVRTTVAALTTKAFSHSIEQTQDVCDVYGVIVDGGWYLKLCIDETVPELAVVSFHPLDRPLRTNGGEVKPKGWQATPSKPSRGGIR